MLKYLIFAVCLIGLGAQAQAQTKYRCGNSFQDKPCSDGKGNVIGGSQKQSTLPSSTQEKSEKIEPDSECKRRGSEALKVIWKRNGGALKEDLLKEATSYEQRRSISDVYANRGNALDVKSKIEKECMAEKYSTSPFVQRNVNSAEQFDETNSNKKDIKEIKELTQNSNADRSAAIKSEQCTQVKVMLLETIEKQAAGASASEMDKLRRNKRNLEQNFKELKCS